jgi:hypothetical protein
MGDLERMEMDNGEQCYSLQAPWPATEVGVCWRLPSPKWLTSGLANVSSSGHIGLLPKPRTHGTISTATTFACITPA